MLWDSKCYVEEFLLLINFFAISVFKIFTWKFLIFALLCVHPELVLLIESGIWKGFSSFRKNKKNFPSKNLKKVKIGN